MGTHTHRMRLNGTRWSAVSFLACVLFMSAAFSVPVTMNLTQAWIDLPNSNDIVCYLDILDADQQRVRNVVPSELSANLGGHLLTIDHCVPFEDTREGVAYTVMLDVSGTMRGAPFSLALEGVKRMIDNLRPQDRMALYTFGDTVDFVSDFTDDKRQLLAGLDNMKADAQETLLYRAIAMARRANQRIEPGLPRRRAIVIMSDGKDEGSGITIEDLFRERLPIELPIFSIGFSRIDEKFLEYMVRLSELTHGLYVRVNRAEDFPEQFARMQHVIMRPYRVDMQAPEGIAGGVTRFQVDIKRSDRTLTSGTLVLVGGLPSTKEPEQEPPPPPPPPTFTISLVIQPEEAAKAGAKWRVDNGDWLISGASSQPLSPGTYVIQFRGIGRWLPPPQMEIEVASGPVEIQSELFIRENIFITIIIYCIALAGRPVVYLSFGLLSLLLLLLLLFLIFTRRGEQPEPPPTGTGDMPPPTYQPPPKPTEFSTGGDPVPRPPRSAGLEGGEVRQAASKQPKIKVRLVVLEGPDSDKTYEYSIGEKCLRIGRGAACELRLSDPVVSDVHCELSADGEHVYIADKGSHNGTIVNGIKTRGKSALRDKDVFAMGNTHMRILL